jgi:type III restriction enzyme
MKFRFKIQQFQTDAVNSIVDVFNGQPLASATQYTRDLGDFQRPADYAQQMALFEDPEEAKPKSIFDEDFDVGYANSPISLTDEALLSNIRSVQAWHNLSESDSLSRLPGQGDVSLDVEMETGTGKTYVYIKTMFELHKRYGWSKFIVVVPSIAIREGVLKSFQMTQDHFMDSYGEKARFFVYDSSQLTKLDQFSSDNKIGVMIINIQAFNKSFKEGSKGDSLIIYSRRDDFQGRRPIDVIAANRPIIIMDEPQKMGGDATQEALKNFKPLFLLNYSATHRVKHNLVYVLDALDAYNQKLVKKIEVKGFTVKNLRGTNGYLYLERIAVSSNKPPRALIEIEVGYSKTINRETRFFDVGDSIYAASQNMEQYHDGYVISEINPIENTVTLTNGEVLKIGEATGDVSENDIRRIQIRETILSHFKKEEEMFNKGIKVLSLFFIDEVAKYRIYDEDGNAHLGVYGQIFEEEYNRALNEYGKVIETPYVKYLLSIKTEDTHKGYFSIDKKGHMTDPSLKRNSEDSDDVSAYDLILKDKERLLSFEEPTRFIFSHSALREGWDNPNVFQICTLKHSSNDIQRRQEVGRGLRLCVNKDGERMDATVPGIRVHDINRLTVITDESYDAFVRGLQSQIKDNLFDRPTKATASYFTNKTVTIEGKLDTRRLTSDDADKIIFYLISHQYIDEERKVTDKYKNDATNATLALLPESLRDVAPSVHKLIQHIYDSSVGIEIDDGNQSEIEENGLNKNFDKQEFQELWKCINHKYAYRVEFDSNELIKKAIDSINNNLYVTKLVYTVSTGEQRDNIEREQIDNSDSFKTAETHSSTIQSFASDSIAYDLLGKIREKTQLTRKTVATILKGISYTKFEMYKANPEEFITKVSKLINDEKATMIVEHVAYEETAEEPFSTDIFTQSKNQADFLKAFKAEKSIQDYVFTDGTAEQSVEKRFATALDSADEVVVYAKLPKGFYIPTPVGNYSPDWGHRLQEGDDETRLFHR